MTSRLYDAPSGIFGRRFVYTLTAKLTGFWQRHWKVERFIVFQTMILQRTRHMTNFRAIRRRINRCLYAWEAGDFEFLAEDKVRTCTQYLSTSRGEETT